MQVFSVRCETNPCKNIFLFLRYATLINKLLESMRNILVMHSRSLTFAINQVQVLTECVNCLTASEELSEAALTQSQLFPSRDGCVLRGSHIRLWMYEHHVIHCMLSTFEFDAFPKED